MYGHNCIVLVPITPPYVSRTVLIVDVRYHRGSTFGLNLFLNGRTTYLAQFRRAFILVGNLFHCQVHGVALYVPSKSVFGVSIDFLQVRRFGKIMAHLYRIQYVRSRESQQ